MEKKPVQILVCRKCGAKNSAKRKKCRKCGATLKRNILLKIAVGIITFFALLVFICSRLPANDASTSGNDILYSTPSEPANSISPASDSELVPTETPIVTITPTVTAEPTETPSPTPEVTPSPEPTIEPTPDPAPEAVIIQNSDEPMRAIVIADSVRVFRSPDETSPLLDTLNTDTVMVLHSIDGEWVKIENENGEIGFAKLSEIKTISQSDYVNQYAGKEFLRVIVTEDSVNVYELPDETSKFLGAMKKGSIMRIHEIHEGWAKVENEKGAIGYAKVDVLKVLNEKEYTVQVTPTPKPANKSYVWVTENGKSYHSSSKCSNMGDPRKMELSKAKSRGYTRCPKCW